MTFVRPRPIRAAAALAALGLLAAFPPGPARADVAPFQTPSGNIQCSVGEDFDVPADVICTILRREGPPAAPTLAACGAGQGHRFRLSEAGPVEASCDPAPVANPNAEVAPYGVAAQWGALRCLSTERGFECENGDGHGFLLSRASQRVW